MRPAPVHSAAREAPAELIVVSFCQRLELSQDDLFVHRFEKAVAREAARERRDSRVQSKAPEHLPRLFFGQLRTHIAAVLNGRMHEQPPITREQHAIFSCADRDKLRIARGAIIGNVESEQAEAASERAEMNVRNKAFERERLQMFARKQLW